MNWEAIGAISEVIGAIVVVITLAYLAIQIRQNTKTTASALRQSFYDYTTRQMLHGTDSTELSALIAKAGMTNESLSPGERIQILRLYQAVFVGYQGAYFQYKKRVLDKEDWTMCRVLLRSFWLFNGREHIDTWEQLKTGGFLDEQFVRECESLRLEAAKYARQLDEKDMSFRSS
jgi:hypothetical protein